MPKNTIVRRLKRASKKYLNRESAFVAGAVLLVAGLITYGIMQTRIMINPIAYKPLLELIAKGESRGNYNAYFGSVGNQSIRFTEMSVGEVLAWQAEYVAGGSPSNAVGRYQFIRPTLAELIDELKINTETIFDKALQDRLAIALLERRGSVDFVAGDIPPNEFAHNLSKEWAALPRVLGDSPEASYYAGDGLNASLIKSSEILAAIELFELRAEQR